MKLSSIALALSLATSAQAQWRPALTAGASAALLFDATTSWISLQNGAIEQNVILGSHPSAPLFISYNAVWLGINTFAPKKARPWINAATLLVELVVIAQNDYFWSKRNDSR